MKIIGLIPARLASSRFPGKPLVTIGGLPMIVHVMKRSLLCKELDGVFVATDSREIADTVTRYGGRAIMTSKRHRTGTDRIAEAVKGIDCDVAINIQGDEPLVNPSDLSKLAKVMRSDSKVKIATLVCKSNRFDEITDCKLVLDIDGNILYISRADIPSNSRIDVKYLYKHHCIVAFRRNVLEKFASWKQSPLEKIEYIEYLRIIEHGYKIKAVFIDDYAKSLDTPEDLKTIKKMMAEDKVKLKYLNKNCLVKADV